MLIKNNNEFNRNREEYDQSRLIYIYRYQWTVQINPRSIPMQNNFKIDRAQKTLDHIQMPA